MARRLKKLHITRVDRVADPANPDSRIVMFKSRQPGETDMADEPNNLDLDDAAAVEAFLNGMLALQDDGESEDDTPAEITDEQIVEAIEGMDTEALIAAAKGRVFAQADDEDTDSDEAEAEFMKSMPEAMRLKLEKANANEVRIAKMEAATRLDSFVSIAKSDMPSLTENSDAVGRLLADVAEALGDDEHELVKTLTRVLKAASAQAEMADDVLTKSKGVNGQSVAPDSAEGEIEKRAAELAKSNNMSIAQATRKVMEDDPTLLRTHLDEI